jgi:hypothetical protein
VVVISSSGALITATIRVEHGIPSGPGLITAIRRVAAHDLKQSTGSEFLRNFKLRGAF